MVKKFKWYSMLLCLMIGVLTGCNSVSNPIQTHGYLSMSISLPSQIVTNNTFKTKQLSDIKTVQVVCVKDEERVTVPVSLESNQTQPINLKTGTWQLNAFAWGTGSQPIYIGNATAIIESDRTTTANIDMTGNFAQVNVTIENIESEMSAVILTASADSKRTITTTIQHPGPTINATLFLELAAWELSVNATSSTQPFSQSGQCKLEIVSSEAQNKTITVCPVDKTPPQPVSGLTAKAGDGTALLTWTDPTDPDFNEVILDCDAFSSPKTVAKGLEQYTLTQLQNGHTYNIQVKTKDTNGNASNATSITVTPSSGKGDLNGKITFPSDVTSIQLNHTQLTLSTGQNQVLIATVIPATAVNKVTWLTSNKWVATVDSNGRVQAVGTGIADIIAISATAENVSAVCTVTVEN